MQQYRKNVYTVLTEGTRFTFNKHSTSETKSPQEGCPWTTAPSGSKSILILNFFIDEFSNYIVTYLKQKSHISEKLQEYMAMVRNRFQRKPQVLHTQ